MRVVQLKNLDLYLSEARNRLSEARRKLQDLAAEDAVTRAEAALVALKRAREQLLDPITVLREVASEQLVLMQQTYGVAEATLYRWRDEFLAAGEAALAGASQAGSSARDRQVAELGGYMVRPRR